MVSKFTLPSLLLAAAVLAIPSSLAETPIARGHKHHQPRPTSDVVSCADAALDATRVKYAYSYAGAVLHASSEALEFEFVSGTLIVPRFRVVPEYDNSALFSLGIGNHTNKACFIKAGFGFKSVKNSGPPNIFAFYSVYDDGSAIPICQDEFTVEVGDMIDAEISLYSERLEAGLKLFNRKNNHVISRSFAIDQCVVGKDVGWLIGSMGRLPMLSTFDRMTFSNVYAKNVQGDNYSLANATFFDIQRGTRRYTCTQVSGENMLIIQRNI